MKIIRQQKREKIYDFIQRLLEIKKSSRNSVVGNFNGIRLGVTTVSTFELLMGEYNKKFFEKCNEHQ